MSSTEPSAKAELKRLIADRLVWWAFRLDPKRFQNDQRPSPK